jgi:hypothetical protein
MRSRKKNSSPPSRPQATPDAMSAKPTGWCYLHHFTINQEKFNAKCRSARGGKQCRYFTRRIPEWRKRFGYDDKTMAFRKGGTSCS